MTETTDRPPAGTGWWRRLAALIASVWNWLDAMLRGPEPAPPPPPPPPPPLPDPLVVRRDAKPMAVAARDFAFDFQVHASFVWTCRSLADDVLASWVDHLMPHACAELRRVAAERARDHDPHRPRAFETDLNRTLAVTGVSRYECRGAVIECRPYVRVHLDPRVREQVQTYWERRMKLECEHEVEVLRADLSEQRAERWLAVLEKLTTNPLAGGAARLTEEEFAAVVLDMLRIRREEADRNDALMEAAVRASTELGAYERAEAFELLKEQLRSRARTSEPVNGNGSARHAGHPA